MKFKYRELNLPSPFSKKQKLQRSVIPISISSNSVSLRYEALIDSGADFSILPVGLAEILEINLDKLSKIYFTGATGDVTEGIISEINLELEGEVFKTKIVFASLPKNVGILGQYGFFDKFVVKFDLVKKEIELKPRK
ncbi:MAG: aspartyl protease family protein [Patescibacteria group bacterium]